MIRTGRLVQAFQHRIGRGFRILGCHRRNLGRFDRSHFRFDRRNFRFNRSFHRQRPVAQVLQTATGDVQDLVAIGATLAQGFEVILEAGHRVGQCVQLLAAGHPALAYQFDRHVLANAHQVVGGLGQFQHPQCAGDFRQQARDLGQLGVVPVGLDEGHEAFARRGEIVDGFLRQRLDRALRLGAGHFLDRRAGFTQAGDLVVQRSVDIEQGAGDIQQRTFVSGTFAAYHLAQRIALLHDYPTGHAQTEHAQGIGHVAQFVDLDLQRRDFRAGTQVQIQRVLDTQQFFLDRRADRVQQRAVAPADAAACVVQFGFAGQLRIQRERSAQFVECGVPGRRLRHQVEQLAGRFLAGRGRADAAFLLAGTHRAAHARIRLAQHRSRRQGAVAQRIGDR